MVKDQRTPPLDLTIQAKVLDLDRNGGHLAVEDETSAAILRLTLPDEAWAGLAPGAGVQLDFKLCSFSQRGCVIECGLGPVIDLDGRHPPLTEEGAVYLEKGSQPFLLEWFNGQATSNLELEIRRSGQGWRSPDKSWFRPSQEGETEGLHIEKYTVPAIVSVTEIPETGAEAEGTVPTIDATPYAGRDDVALRFSGVMLVEEPGIHQLRLTCDDGAQVYVGRSIPAWKRIDPPAASKGAAQRKPYSWETRSGAVTYAAPDKEGMRLELLVDSTRVEVCVLESGGMDPAQWVGSRLRVSGMNYPGGICSLTSALFSPVGSANSRSGPLMRAFEVRELQPEDADCAHPVVLEGVVTMANSRSLVLQDDSGGIFVLAGGDANLSPIPVPGERWRVEGVTKRGDFSPIVVSEKEILLGFGALPEPRRPTWEEILNGMLDAERVEIEGVIIAATEAGVDLLTYEGVATIKEAHLYPLPEGLQSEANRRSMIGARVRMRGVFAPNWDISGNRLHLGEFFLGNAGLSVVEPAPADFKASPRIEIPDLWRFTTKSTALKRVRLRGRLMASRGNLHLISDGENVLRLDSPEVLPAELGDVIDAAGFPRLGAISPVLVRATVKVEKRGSLPAARRVEPSELRGIELDGQMVSVEAKVVSDTLQQRERRLELEAGDLRFLAAGLATELGSDLLPRDSRVRLAGVYFAGLGSSPAESSEFELRLADAGGIEVLAMPPWWNSRRLAILALALLAGLGLVAAWAMVLHRLVARRTNELAIEIHEREQVETQRKLEEERARVARDLHDELGAGLTEIGMLGSLLGRHEVASEKKDAYLGTLRDLARDLVSGLDEIVWAINPSYDSVDDAASYLWLQAQRLLNPAGIECSIRQGDNVRDGQLGSRRRHALLLAFKESLNNVVRHSQATAIDASIQIEGEFVVVSITDNGVGFEMGDPASPGHQGLTGMRERMRALGGDCRIDSVISEGTTVSLYIPLKAR